MAIETRFRTDDAQIASANVDKEPDICPICHYGIRPIGMGIGQFVGRSELELVFQCPCRDCQRLFIGRYHLDSMSSRLFQLYRCVPRELSHVQFSETIQAVSREFCEIYDQASQAERYGLVLVAGPGYRKALEFLIKDYLCRLHPKEKAKVEKMQLGACVSTYVNDARLKASASRAAWLGNDETHYLRKWEGKDLTDLKKLIEATTHWVEMEELTKTAVDEMPEAK
jgi:hypothetical protein